MKSPSRARFGGTLAAAALAALAGGSARAQTPIAIRAAITPVYYDAVPILYAEHTGAFERAGIDLQLGRLPTGASITAAIAGGSLDVGKSTFLSVISAFARGVPIVAIAPAAIYLSSSPNGAIVVPKDSSLRGLGDLVGKVVAVNSLGEPTRPAIDVWLVRNGFPVDGIKLVEVPMAAMQAALDAHRIDAAMLTAPIYDEALATDKYRVVSPVLDQIAPRWLFSSFVASLAWANANRDAVRRFASVLASAATYTNSHRTELVPLVSSLVGAPASAFARTPWPTAGTDLVVSDMQPLIDASARAGLIPKAFDARAIVFSPDKA
jgi:ABC-type nitrate/sulfonate/bicarbonate transport system substrate-binding protein